MREGPFQDDAMHDQIRIAPDGRCEMGVLVKRQREVPQRLNGVARLLERAQHQVGQDALLGFAGDFFREALVMLRPNGERLGPGQGTAMGRWRAASRPRPRPAVLRRGVTRRIWRYRHRVVTRKDSGYAERITEGMRQFFKFENLFRIGPFVNAVQRSQAAPFKVLSAQPDWRRA